MPEKRTIILIISLVILLITIPYLYAFQQNDSEWQFGGFLINPVDGHSYLAKMEIGQRGSWIFRLPYTAEPGDGAYLFLFYIFLGHTARLIGAEKVIVFHAARVMSALILGLTIWNLIRKIFVDQEDRKMAALIIMFGSGLGWIAVLGGLFTSDFWVAEAYPFLSAYTNPHFTLGLAIMTWMLTPESNISWVISSIMGLVLAVIQPFAIVIVILVLAARVLIEIITKKNVDWKQIIKWPSLWSLVGIGLSGGVYLVYQYTAILTDPVLTIWNDQNLTPSPGFLDLAISFSPAL